MGNDQSPRFLEIPLLVLLPVSAKPKTWLSVEWMNLGWKLIKDFFASPPPPGNWQSRTLPSTPQTWLDGTASHRAFSFTRWVVWQTNIFQDSNPQPQARHCTTVAFSAHWPTQEWLSVLYLDFFLDRGCDFYFNDSIYLNYLLVHPINFTTSRHCSLCNANLAGESLNKQNVCVCVASPPQRTRTQQSTVGF